VPMMLTYPMGTEPTFLWMAKAYATVDIVYYAVDDVHWRRYKWLFRLLDKRFARKVRPLVVVTGEAYGNAYQPLYVTFYNIGGWLQLTKRYLKARRVGVLYTLANFVWYGVKALWLVGPKKWPQLPKQLMLFKRDRELNKATEDARELAEIAEIRANIWPELLGEDG
jgi:hypothetical protein